MALRLWQSFLESLALRQHPLPAEWRILGTSDGRHPLLDPNSISELMAAINHAAPDVRS